MYVKYIFDTNNNMENYLLVLDANCKKSSLSNFFVSIFLLNLTQWMEMVSQSSLHWKGSSRTAKSF